MAVACGAQRAVVRRRRYLHVGAAHGLDDHRRDVLLLAQHVVDVLGAAGVAGTAAAEAAIARIAGRNVFGARHQRTHVAAEHGLAADRDRVERSAVEGVPHRDRLVPAGRDAGELQRHADRERPAGREQHLAERVECEGPEALRQEDGSLVGESPGRKRQRVELAPDRVDHARVPVADLVDVVAVEVHEPAPVDVGEPDAFGLDERVEAGCRQRLVQVGPGVAVEQGARGPVHVVALPRAAQRRQVDVAFHDVGVEPRPGRRNRGQIQI